MTTTSLNVIFEHSVIIWKYLKLNLTTLSTNTKTFCHIFSGLCLQIAEKIETNCYINYEALVIFSHSGVLKGPWYTSLLIFSNYFWFKIAKIDLKFFRYRRWYFNDLNVPKNAKLSVFKRNGINVVVDMELAIFAAA